MKYYKRNPQDKNEPFQEIKNDGEKQYIEFMKTNPPEEYIYVDFDAGGSSFQDIQTRQEANPDFHAQRDEYINNMIYCVPELKDLKDAALNKLKDTKTDRYAEMHILISKINQADSVATLYDGIKKSYIDILKSPNGSGSRLAKAIQKIFNDQFCIDFKLELTSKNQPALNPVNQYVETARRWGLHTILFDTINNNPTKDKKNQGELNAELMKTVNTLVLNLLKLAPTSTGLKKMNIQLSTSNMSDDVKLEKLKEIAKAQLNTKRLFGGPIERHKKLQKFYQQLITNQTEKLKSLAIETSPEAKKATPRSIYGPHENL